MMFAGFGFRRSATLASLRDALAQAIAALPTQSPALPVGLIATAQDKAQALCWQALANELGLLVHAVPATQINTVRTLTDHLKVRMLRGSGSTAEAAALAAAFVHVGPSAVLLHPRAVSLDRLATCAFAALGPLQKT